jgi:ABC-type transport system involved in multi-copper enzyme maturation permease subunit
MAVCLALGQLSYSEIFRLSLSLGLSGIQICFIGLTIFLGCSIYSREIERKTIYTLLSRPISREQYLIGKYLGLAGLLLLMLISFMMCFTFVKIFVGVPILATSYTPFWGIFLESLVLLSVAFFFSTISKIFLAVTASISFFVIGHWISNLKYLMSKSSNELFLGFGEVIVRLFPDLGALNWRDYAIAKAPVPLYEVAGISLLAVLWLLFYLLAAIKIFRRKDFE